MPRRDLFVAVDVGTTGARASAVDLDGRLRIECRQPYATAFPREGWAEQDPRDWRRAALDALRALMEKLGPEGAEVRAVGLTGQCPTVAPFDAQREPVYAGLLYRDNRAVTQAARMRSAWGEDAMHARTGHVATAFHVGPKILWLREEAPDAYAATDCFLQPRDVVLHALTGYTGTDETHANATAFFDLCARTWAADMLDEFELSPEILPTVTPSWATVGEVSREASEKTGIAAGCPVIVGAADSQCAAFGSGVLGPGPISEMAGASSCLNSLLAAPAADRRITHYSYVTPEWFCTELGINVTGGALTWAIDRLRLTGFDELESSAQSVLSRLRKGDFGDPRAVAPLFLPYLGDGERDDPSLRAGFVGVSERHGTDALAYAVIEGLAFGVAETVEVLVDAGSPLHELRVGGGGARLDALGELKAAVLRRPVCHLNHDSAPVGVALLAAQAVGYATEAVDAVRTEIARAKRFEPDGRLADVIGARYRWFVDVRASAAVRMPPWS
jgi:sugar (pentulose or hexulose) kinase